MLFSSGVTFTFPVSLRQFIESSHCSMEEKTLKVGVVLLVGVKLSVWEIIWEITWHPQMTTLSILKIVQLGFWEDIWMRIKASLQLKNLYVTGFLLIKHCLDRLPQPTFHFNLCQSLFNEKYYVCCLSGWLQWQNKQHWFDDKWCIFPWTKITQCRGV